MSRTSRPTACGAGYCSSILLKTVCHAPTSSQYLEVLWDGHGHHAITEPHRQLWLIAMLVPLSMFLIGIGIGVTSGLIQ